MNYGKILCLTKELRAKFPEKETNIVQSRSDNCDSSFANAISTVAFHERENVFCEC